MIQGKTLYSVLLCLVFFAVSCGDQPEENTEAAEGDLVAIEGVPFNRMVAPDTFLFIAHKVEDYDVWKASFELAQPIREKHGIKATKIYKDKTDTNVVLVLTIVTDIEEAKDYITSEDLQSSMEAAGVVGAMDLYWMESQLAYSKTITDSLLMFMSFNVMNYDRWESAFLDDYKVETGNRDFQVNQVLQGIDDPGEVCMMFAVNDPDYVQKMEKNNAFRMKMLAAGVVSYPVTYNLREMPI